MAVRLRLTRTGRRNKPFYRLGAFDSRTKRDGQAIELLGNYNPHSDKEEGKYNFKVDRIQHWLTAGALPSETVASMLKKLKIEKPKAEKA